MFTSDQLCYNTTVYMKNVPQTSIHKISTWDSEGPIPLKLWKNAVIFFNVISAINKLTKNKKKATI
jgi:hypothetical protein